MESFQVVNDNYVNGILTFDQLSPHEKYQFIMFSFEHLLKLSSDEKTKFILLARKIKRFRKISYSIIPEKACIIASCVEAINNLLSRSSILGDDNLSLTIEKINEVISQVINADSSKITIKKGKIPKDINTVADIIGDEANELIKNHPHIALELLKNSIETQINEIRRVRPIFAKKISDKLLHILKESERLANIDDTFKMLVDIGKELKEGRNFGINITDKQLRAFFDIVSNDDYLKHNNNSEVLRQIAVDLNSAVKENITYQFYTNPAVQAKVVIALTKLLKNKYNYPPDKIKGIAGESGLLVDSIRREIKINPSYFTRGERN
jgi:type I restriction enzyme R subunit